jgi:hypothetical protein
MKTDYPVNNRRLVKIAINKPVMVVVIKIVITEDPDYNCGYEIITTTATGSCCKPLVRDVIEPSRVEFEDGKTGSFMSRA